MFTYKRTFINHFFGHFFSFYERKTIGIHWTPLSKQRLIKSLVKIIHEFRKKIYNNTIKSLKLFFNFFIYIYILYKDVNDFIY